MKKLAYCIAFVLISLSFDIAAQNVITSENIQVDINFETSRENLVSIRTECLAQGIEFIYTPRFNENRKLTHIQFAVKKQGGDVLGQTGMIDLTAPNSRASIRLHKANNKFVADCIGSCE